MPGAFLDGAAEGIKNYLIKWDSTTLSDPMMWTKAIGQVCSSKIVQKDTNYSRKNVMLKIKANV